MSRLTTCLVSLATLAAVCLTDGPARAAGKDVPSWSEVKCARYKKAWAEALVRLGSRGLGPEFIERHDAFLASGCTGRHDVCPSSAEELERANVMTILAMDAGTASTFPPFGCPK